MQLLLNILDIQKEGEREKVPAHYIHYEIAYLIGLDEKVIITAVAVQPKVNKLNIITEETSAKIKGYNIKLLGNNFNQCSQK